MKEAFLKSKRFFWLCFLFAIFVHLLTPIASVEGSNNFEDKLFLASQIFALPILTMLLSLIFKTRNALNAGAYLALSITIMVFYAWVREDFPGWIYYLLAFPSIPITWAVLLFLTRKKTSNTQFLSSFAGMPAIMFVTALSIFFFAAR